MQDGPVRRDNRPLSERVEEAIKARISDGTYGVGEKLPPEEKLAIEMGVSRPTVRTALSRLEAQGYIERRQGLGTFVLRQPFVVDVDLHTIETYNRVLAARHRLPSGLSHKSVDRVPAPSDVAEHLEVEPGDYVTAVRRIVEVNERPVADMIDYLHESVVTADEMRPGFEDSVIDYFDGADGRPMIEWAQTDLTVAYATEEQAKLLLVNVKEALMHFEESFLTGDRRLVSLSRSLVVPEFFRFHIDRRVIRSKG